MTESQWTEEERAFVARRTRLVKSWPLVGTAILLMVIGLGAWLFFFAPGLANPRAVFEQLRAGTLSEADLSLRSALLPVVVLLCLALLLAMTLLAFAAMKNERRHLAMLRRLAPPGGR